MNPLPIRSAALLSVAIAGASVFATNALVLRGETDYRSLPPRHGDVESALRGVTISLPQAMEIAVKHAGTGAIAGGAAFHTRHHHHGHDHPAHFDITVYRSGEAMLILVDASSGSVLSSDPLPWLPGTPFKGEPVTTASGLMYWDILEGSGSTLPAPDALVRLHLDGYLVDGRQFESGDARGEPITMPANGFVAGFGEALATMKAGGRRKVVVPPDLAFGAEGSPPVIPANATLIFDIHLLSIMDYSTVPALLPGDPVRGQPVTLPSGLMYYDLVEGQGDQPQGPSTRVRVHYSGWLNDGTKFDSSIDRGQPATFALNQVIRGWTEGVASMRVGGRRKLVIPFDLAYGPQGRAPTIPPKALLVFDIELLEVLP